MQHSKEQSLTNVLASTRFRSVTYVEETGSTNSDLLVQLSSGQAHAGDVLVADHQSDGKGRNQRSWLDHKGAALLTSIACELPTELASLTPIATGLAVVDAIDEIAPCAGVVGLKWPNDILATRDKRKLSGILVESLHSGARNKNIQLVIGIGLNLRWEQPPKEIAEVTTALEQLVGESIERDDILGRVLQRLDDRLTQLEEQDTATMLEAYRNRCLTLGQPVTRSTSQGAIAGIARDINNQGELLVELESGAVVTVTVGDVTHLR